MKVGQTAEFGDSRRLRSLAALKAVASLWRSGRPALGGPALLCTVAAITLFASASPALAAQVHSLAGEFGSHGSGAGQFDLFQFVAISDPPSGGGMAVDQSNGDLYVADSNNQRVEKFDADGNFIAAWGWGVKDGLPTSEVCASNCQAGIRGTGPGQLTDPGYVAVDNSGGPSHGDVYVAGRVYSNLKDQYEGGITKFDSEGHMIGVLTGAAAGTEFTTITGIATDPVGHLWTFESTGYVREFQPDGTFITQFRANNNNPPQVGIALDANHDVFANNGKYAAGGQYLASFWLGSGVGVDQVNGEVYVSEDNRDFISEGLWVRRFDLDRHPLEPPFGAGDLKAPGPPAVDSATRRVYVADREADKVLYFDYVTVPDIGALPATDLGHEQVTVNAHVDPLGTEATECIVEYGLTAEYGESRPCAQSTPYSSPLDVSATLTGLTTLATYHYRFVVANARGRSVGPDQTVVPPSVLALSTDPADQITQTAARLNGSLDPEGEATEFFFEYGLDATYGQRTETQLTAATSGVQPVTPAPIVSLSAGREYHYRIVATNALGTTFGPDRTFSARRPPAVSAISARNLSAETADLLATIDSKGSATNYRFEYGLTTNYEHQLPLGGGELPAGASEEVSVHLSGLSPNATYHFRVIASSDQGQTTTEDHVFNFSPPACPNATVRQQTGAGYLPDCRAYELVSPPNTGGIQLIPGTPASDYVQGYNYLSPNSGLAADPPRFAYFAAFGQLEGKNTPNVFEDLYVATRGSSGWQTSFPGLLGSQFLATGDVRCNQQIDRCIDYHLSPPAFFENPFDAASNAPYLIDLEGQILGRLPTDVNEVNKGEQFVGATLISPDFSHFAFTSRNVRFLTGALITSPGSAYDNEIASGQVSLISKTPAGQNIARDPAATGQAEAIALPAISRDGSHILMSTEAGGTPGYGLVHLYMRVDDAVSYDISQGPATFVGMTDGGEEVLFLSRLPLTEDDSDESVDLYRWSEASGSLTRLSVGVEGTGNRDDCAVGWIARCDVEQIHTGSLNELYGAGVARLDRAFAPRSGDVYFYSPESLTGEAVNHQRNFYLYRDGQVRYVASLQPDEPIKRIQVSPDGEHVAFLTASTLTDQVTAGHDVMYTYSPADDRVICVSCSPDGAIPTSDTRASENGLFMSNDGRTFFSTDDSLTPRDSDGLRSVYEYVDGEPQLISSGLSVQDRSLSAGFGGTTQVGLEAVSADGNDVYFSTFDTLVPQDHNGQFLKFYDARTAGGFALAAQGAPCAAADECHGAGSEAPPPSNYATAVALGERGGVQNAVSRKNGHRRRHPHRRRAKHHPRRAHRGAHSG